MNVAGLLKAFDTVVALGEVARRMTAAPAKPGVKTPDSTELAQTSGLAGQLEARLTNVVVAALKEAFDRDHARLELERVQMEEQRRRAEEALRLEMRRQAIDREVARLRLLAGAALGGWAASLVVLVLRIADMALASRLLLAGGGCCCWRRSWRRSQPRGASAATAPRRTCCAKPRAWPAARFGCCVPDWP